MSTGQTIALIKALGGSGGGGGSEETFSKVYETTTQNSDETLIIQSSDMGGAYVDVVLYLSNLQPMTNDKAYNIIFSSSESGGDVVAGDEGVLPGGGDWAMSISVMSVGGLMESGKAMEDINGSTGYKKFVPFVSAYPSPDMPKVSAIGIMMQDGIPTGTTITVYARKKVS